MVAPYLPGAMAPGAAATLNPILTVNDLGWRYYNDANLTVYTSGSGSIGTEAEDRYLVVVVSSGDGDRVVSSVNVSTSGRGSVNMNKLAETSGGAVLPAAIFGLKTDGTDLGATASITVTFSTTANQCYFAPFTITGSKKTQLYDILADINLTSSDAIWNPGIEIPKNGAIIGIEANSSLTTGTADINWFGSFELDAYTSPINLDEYYVSGESNAYARSLNNVSVGAGSAAILACWKG